MMNRISHTAEREKSIDQKVVEAVVEDGLPPSIQRERRH